MNAIVDQGCFWHLIQAYITTYKSKPRSSWFLNHVSVKTLLIEDGAKVIGAAGGLKDVIFMGRWQKDLFTLSSYILKNKERIDTLD